MPPTPSWPAPTPVAPPFDPTVSWQVAAGELDEHALAIRIGERSAAPDLTARAYDLVLLGRAAQARDELARSVAPPVAPGGAPTARDLVLAAAHAACGDDGAWRWLLAAASHRDGGPWLARLAGAVADARGDLATGDAAWSAAARGGAPGHARLRAGVAAVLGRRRDDIDALRATLDQVVRTATDDADSRPDGVLTIARTLHDRGDDAGARLVLRTALRRDLRSPPLRAALEALEGRRRARAVVKLVVTVLVVVGVMLALSLVMPIREARVLMWIALPLGAGVWARRVRLPGLTAAESAVWRGVRGSDDWGTRLRVGEETATGDSAGGWYGLAAILGAVAGWLAAAGVVALATGSGDGFGDAGLLVYLGGALAGGTLAVLATRPLVRVRRRVRAGRIDEALGHHRAAQGAVCRCRTTPALRGWLAEETARQHLVDAHLAPPLPASQVRWCQATGTLWLAGPLAADGSWVALRGPAPRPAMPQPHGPGAVPAY